MYHLHVLPLHKYNSFKNLSVKRQNSESVVAWLSWKQSVHTILTSAELFCIGDINVYFKYIQNITL